MRRLWDDGGQSRFFNIIIVLVLAGGGFAAWVFARLCQKPESAAGLAQAAKTSVELRSSETHDAVIGRTLDLLWRLRIIEKAQPGPGPAR